MSIHAGLLSCLLYFPFFGMDKHIYAFWGVFLGSKPLQQSSLLLCGFFIAITTTEQGPGPEGITTFHLQEIYFSKN